MALVLMAAVCAVAGLVIVHRIAGTVSTHTEIAMPLLLESMALNDNADAMRAAFLEGTTRAHVSEDQVIASLARLDEEGGEHLLKASELAAKLGLATAFEAVTGHRQRFVATLQEMTRWHWRKQAADAAVAQRSRHLTAALESTGETLHQVGSSVEARIIANEEAAKVEIQAGIATVDRLGSLFSRAVTGDFPVLEYTHKLARNASQLGHISHSAAASLDLTGVARLETEAADVIKSATSIRRRLTSRLRAVGDENLAATVNRSLENLQALLMSEDGLFAAKRKSLTAAAEIAAGTTLLDSLDSLYTSVLREVEAAVRRSNQQSKEQADRTIVIGIAVIAALVILSCLLAFATAAFLTRAVVVPLKRLTDYVNANREGSLRLISDPAILRSRDELGGLARAFNRMTSELTQARNDLIARSEAEISKQVERLQAALRNMSQGLCMFDSDQRLVLANEQYARIYGVPPERIRPGMSLHEIVAERVAAGSYYGDRESHVERYVAANANNNRSNTIIELNNGRSIHIVKEPMGNGGWVATLEDVTERRQTEARIAHMARHDALTGLPNRLLFREKMEEAFARVARGEHIAVHCLDLDYFKTINDTLGHPIGDALLRAVTERLLGTVREHDTISRLGGDEFAIIQVVDDAPVEATNLAQRIIETLSQPYEIDAHQVVIGTSIGIAIAPDDGRAPDELLKNADLALYRAKADGRSTYRFFEPEMDARMQARRKLELDLRKALVSGEFQLYYQPLVKVETNAITGFEALLRWRHPERGLVFPGDFIPVLEELALIVAVGEWILKEACREAATWPDELLVSVNISPLQFKSHNLVHAVRSTLEETGIPAHRLELEITETVLLGDSDANLATLHKLKDLGVKIAMDDFGTGYSSLSYLRSFPFDRIKIDRSFTRDIALRSDCLAIVRAVTTLGDSLGIATTAEGVETQAQLDRLRAEGCTDVQGFFFSPPRPASEVAGLIAKGRESRNIAA
jgi:diguanylate cyclase (GGDEF)-like protein/PAS domain S-box-containing protein